MENGKANKSFLHPLHLSLFPFLTFLLSLALSCRKVSAWVVTVFVPLGLQWCVGCTACLLWALVHCSSVTHGRKYPLEAIWGGRVECLNTTKERCFLHVAEPLWASRVSCPSLSAKLPVGHSRAEELFTLAILRVNSKIVNSKKNLFKVCRSFNVF